MNKWLRLTLRINRINSSYFFGLTPKFSLLWELLNFNLMKEVFCIGEVLIDFVAEKQGSNLSLAREFTKKPVVLRQM